MKDSTATLETLLETNANLEKEIRSLKEQLAWFQRQIFGKRSEKIMESSEQPTLFDLNLISPQEEFDEKQIKGHTRKTPKGKDASTQRFLQPARGLSRRCISSEPQ